METANKRNFELNGKRPNAETTKNTTTAVVGQTKNNFFGGGFIYLFLNTVRYKIIIYTSQTNIFFFFILVCFSVFFFFLRVVKVSFSEHERHFPRPFMIYTIIISCSNRNIIYEVRQ